MENHTPAIAPKPIAPAAKRKRFEPIADTAFGRLLECMRNNKVYVPEPFAFDSSQKVRGTSPAPGATPPNQPIAAFAADNGLPVSMLMNYVDQGLITTLGEDYKDLYVAAKEAQLELNALRSRSRWMRPKEAA